MASAIGGDPERSKTRARSAQTSQRPTSPSPAPVNKSAVGSSRSAETNSANGSLKRRWRAKAASAPQPETRAAGTPGAAGCAGGGTAACAPQRTDSQNAASIAKSAVPAASTIEGRTMRRILVKDSAPSQQRTRPAIAVAEIELPGKATIGMPPAIGSTGIAATAARRSSGEIGTVMRRREGQARSRV